jgi:hypothetical protein
MDRINNVAAVLRHCGERTMELAHSTLEQIFPSRNIHIVTGVPFSDCLRKAYQCGQRADLPLTLCVDADVILDAAGVRSLIDFARRDQNQVFQWQAYCFDRYMGIERPVGFRLYRTDSLKNLEQVIPEEGTSVRPESDAIAAIVSQGFRQRKTSMFVGIHDFHQYYHDVYRKCYLQAHKHAAYLDYPIRMWEALGNTNPDFVVALLAVQDGRLADSAPEISKSFRPPSEIEKRLSTLDLPPQDKTLPDYVSASQVRDEALLSIPTFLRSERAVFAHCMDRLFQGQKRHWLSRLTRSFLGKAA